MIAFGLFAEFRAYSDMNNPNKKPTDEQIQQGLAAFNELGAIFDEFCNGLEPSGGHRIAGLDFEDPETDGGEIHRDDWPKGLAEYLHGCYWQLTSNEHNLIIDCLENYWKLPRHWGVNLFIESRYIDAGPIDNPEDRD